MTLTQSYLNTRQRFVEICRPLKIEDYSVQPEVFVSPPKWHLAHTTWFFEQFVLVSHKENYKVFDKDFAYLFNSYYNNAGDRVLRPNRGLMTRPSVEEVYHYRDHVDREMIEFLESKPDTKIQNIVQLGIQHEQQHQELFYYDIKYILGHQPTFPLIEHQLDPNTVQEASKWVTISEGIYEIGFNGQGFCYDNELGRHKVYLQEFEISNQLVTNRDYLAFIESGGYDNFNLWHADGWDYIKQNTIDAPLYWYKVNGSWKQYSLDGFHDLRLDEPVLHVSYYEAFAFAEWQSKRLPTEFEWEAASSQFEFGQLWEWTNSAYLPYPKFSKAPGALGEYNGKFMINQMVLRGASNATVIGHSRPSYRNFFHPDMRWQFSGIRLAK
ncbi:ergothioneine biosynthesis protein EgtB [Psychroserpens sp.]|uniref:ergothioneine biosynthesis protein EgtB n=1 Tax=Psychroserpens sp. TaxID=2020870 RepID=UPI001B2A823D|nr:ergothioneine biosynthesis protein EgtB [Psychroserpens sp.]MBO6605751.1 ergothioneine biosynthesis protein EgtB [Psychroserpens sp.]MBO6630121.1 ergothioneine biosynthesis protein EgtB [Psychroserpens sp.]MBO6652878.1 ergothioneine biosynthesis protein EgtB [Psychroserpens sp.]MBO6681350.1 ergothioneine biosynthesis protein EgtB [Psychroserpens sp.]MBO6749125.1 ergothioneine biosynthesis protein EgtB [Psychroserpens sp.]